MNPRRLLVVDNDPIRRNATIAELQAAGYDTENAFIPESVDAVVLRVVDDSMPPFAHGVPVIAVVDDDDPEVRLRTAIAGAVRCVGPDAVVDTIGTVLADDAPSLADQVRRARIDALEALACGDQPAAGDDRRCRVRLTRLEQRPVRAAPSPVVDGASRLASCTPKQRELLDVIARAGGVTDAALLLGTSRSTIYATLRRIAHRLQLRDSADLLRIIGIDERHPASGRL